MPGIVEGSSLIVLTFSDVVVREEINDFPLPRQGGQEDGGTGYIFLIRIDSLDQRDTDEEVYAGLGDHPKIGEDTLVRDTRETTMAIAFPTVEIEPVNP